MVKTKACCLVEDCAEIVSLPRDQRRNIVRNHSILEPCREKILLQQLAVEKTSTRRLTWASLGHSFDVGGFG